MRSRFIRALLVCAVVTGLLIHRADTLRAVSSGVVISQVYGGGGATTGSPAFKNDYIELFNRGNAPVSLAGMSVQYASSTGNFTQATALPSVTLQPGQYFLVQEGTAAGALGAALPTPDATGTISMSATTGKIALVNGTTALGTTGCPLSGSIVDLLGYGTGANCFEGTATAALTNTTAAIRALQGCTDTDANSSDFAIGAPAPRNTATTIPPCGGGDTAPSVSSSAPAGGATNVAVSSSIVINFSESVTASSSAFTLECPAGSPRAFTQSASPASSFTLTPTSPLPAGATCSVKVTANQIIDADTTDPPDFMAADHTFSFATANLGDTAPSVTGTSPANGASNVPVASTIVINFSESVTASLSAFSIQCPTTFPQSFLQSAGPATSFTLTPSSPLPYSTNCTVSVTADQISDTDGIPPAGMASDVAFSFMTSAAPPPGAGTIRINEVDADTPGSDTAEFVELYDGGLGNTALDGLVVVFYDGGLSPFTGNQSIVAFDLDGYTTDPQGYFVLGNPGVPNATLTFLPGEFGLLPNGPDAVGLYIGNGSDFPNGTIATTTNLQDAIVYGTDDPSPSNLLPLINAGQKIVNENATGNSQMQSSQRCPDGMGGFRNTSTYYPGVPTPGTVNSNSCPSARPPSDVVISQIYAGGGNAGASWVNDYVELYNRGAGSVDLTGWSLQYASSTGSGWDFNKQPLGGSIGAGEYYLIALASGGANGTNLPPANISGQINMAAGSGKIALVNSFTALVGNCPIFNPTIKDLVGYGTADCGEGSTTASAGSNTTALFRKNDGSVDTDNNANDFAAPATPTPRRTAPIVELGPNVLTTDPRFNGTDAARDATILVTFTETVDVDNGWFALTCASSGAHYSATFAESFGGRDQYITPNDNFTAGEQCTVTILKDRIHDQDFDDSGANTDTLPANYSWSFTVATGTEPPYPPSVHLAMGNPSAAGSDPLNYLMEKPEFAVSYNRDLGRPNWVSWHISDEWVGTLSRVDTFRPDPQVPPEWYRVQSFDFSGSGFDRGHMTPNADRDKETSIPINQATFLMSNMIAQAPGNNQGPWAAFEAYLRTLVEQPQQNEVYIVSGPFGVGGTGSNGGTTSTLAGGQVTVPSSTWKVALALPKGNDDVSRVSCSTRTIAVIMPNQDAIRPNAWETYVTTVDAVEALTGYDLFSNLPEPYQRCIEAGTNGNNPPLVKGDQTITFTQPPDGIYGDPPFVVGATGGASGNPVTFVASGACTSGGLNGATITLVAQGSCSITASQAGNDIYNAAADLMRTFAVNADVAPSASPTQSPSATAAGWNNTDVTVTWNWTDVGVSGIDPAGCTASSVSSGEGGAIALSATCSDFVGNTGTASYTVKVDKTAPTVALVGGPTGGGSYYFGAVPVAPTCSASDALSGLAAACTVSGYSTVVGPHTVVATATDKAGNVKTASATYTVLPWTVSGLYAPVDMGVWNTVRGGATVPLAFEVFAGSTELTDTSVIIQPLTATQSPCSGGPTDDIEIVASGGTVLRYDASTGRFVYNWQTPRKPGFCYVVTITLTDGSSLSGKIQLR
jgi:DNA/RNA endonuclease G (NUC1)